MTTTHPELLVLLKDKESLERDRRSAHVAGLRQRLTHAQSQAQQLSTYRRHYQDHWQLQFRSGATPQVLQCYRQFVERLDAAMAQQAHTVHHVQALVAQAEQELLQQEIRLAGIDKVLQRRVERTEQSQRRAQQRQDDESAQRSTRHAAFSMPMQGL